MSHLHQTIRNAQGGRCTLAGADSLLPGMIADLEQRMPPTVKAQCDAILGPEATPHQRWTMYFTAERHYRHHIESEVCNDDHSDPHLHRAE